MRPSDLDPFFAPVTRLGGIGPKLAPLFDTLIARPPHPARVIDLLLHLPISAVDRSLAPDIAAMPTEGIGTVRVRVEAHHPAPPGRSRAPHRVMVGDDTGDITLVFFRLPKAQIEQMLPLGAERVISGRVEVFDGTRQMVHPDRILPLAKFEAEPQVEPVYPLTEGLTSRRVSLAARAALERAPEVPEWLEPSVLAKRRWPGFREALHALHEPQTASAIGPETPAWQRLAYDELLAGQLALQIVRQTYRAEPGRSTTGDGRMRQAILAALPYALTGAQDRAVDAISTDMASSERMLRLLQGDVGAGKTIVALLAMANAVEAGRQAALMAPTEILARQHFERLEPLARAAGIRMTVLTGRGNAAEKRAALAAIAEGAVDIVVGTHALFQPDVIYRDLALAVVDEQHRFGVEQRLALAAKGAAVDLLLMTATPIPRTLVMSYFGDMDVSILDEKPPGRKPIDTRTISIERLGEVVAGLGRAIESGARIYWVCPLVGESEKLDIAAAEERFASLEAAFPGKVGLVHGKMGTRAKDDTIARFASGEIAVLVATTVIEVGVDVPAATIMVIEDAQRYGLAQLHQLRGRVGRGGDRSTAMLLFRGPLSETAEARLRTIRETEDGFRIAEEDLRLRGEGDLLGTRQSGLPGFRLARLDLHQELLAMARDDAALALQRDPALAGPRGEALRRLLYLFERDDAIRMMQAG